MPAIVCNLAALTVVSIFYAWRATQSASAKNERQLRQRVSYLLWVVANQAA